MLTRVYILLGGVIGWDGYADSRGLIDELKPQLDEIYGVTCVVFDWDQYPAAALDIKAHEGKSKIVGIGFSGGASRLTYVANESSKPVIDLLIGYDPSPPRQVMSLGNNVKKAICYHNTRPLMWVPFIGQLGGGQYTGTCPIETHDFAQQHLTVDYNRDLHAMTVAAVRALAKQ